MILKCLLLKDNPDTTRLLTGYIEKTDTLSLELTVSDLAEAVNCIEKIFPDIVFLSLQQFSQIKSRLNDKEKIPVFICHSSHAETYSTVMPHVLLLENDKSISYASFLDAVNKSIILLLGSRYTYHYKDENYFFIKSEYRIVKVKFDDILFCEGLKDYTQIYTSKKSKPIITLQNLKTFSDRLPSKNFVRIHRSYIVSLNHVESISKKEVEVGERIIPIGNSYRSNLLDIVKLNS